jgi:HD-GYP domain-containing protein (c-di-GMP phosphodiesterase class II)
MNILLFLLGLEAILYMLLVVYFSKKRYEWVREKISRVLLSRTSPELPAAVTSAVVLCTENSMEQEDVKLKPGDFQKIVDGAVQAVSLIVGSRDPYTAGHQRRVAEIARAIAIELRLSQWQTRGIYIAGLLHDVGKVAVPSEILSKPGKISDDEFSIIKHHCFVGYDILRVVDFPWPVSLAVLQHHERLDGSGYPGGIFDKDIILEAKILGVADVVEAMSSHRPYRPALGLSNAMAEISRGSGILYEPKVVDACLKLFKKNELEFVRLMAAAESRRDYITESVK